MLMDRIYNLDPDKYVLEERMALKAALDEANLCLLLSNDNQHSGKTESAALHQQRCWAILWTLGKLGYETKFDEGKECYDLA